MGGGCVPIDCAVTGRAYEVQSSQSPSWDGEGDPGWKLSVQVIVIIT
jgi:hypothetical protein